jgi:hypothetical protein
LSYEEYPLAIARTLVDNAEGGTMAASSSHMNPRERHRRESGRFPASQAGESVRPAIRWVLLAVLSLLLASAAHADQPLAPSNGTWKRASEFSPEEKARIDWRSETPRDAEIPYLPAEPYPFEAPFTAEELAYRMMNFSHNARWPHTIADVLGYVTKSGYLRQSITVVRIGIFSEQEGLPGQILTPPGSEYLRMFFHYIYPSKMENTQGLWVQKRTDREKRTKYDSFLYSPSLRRVRRLPQARRDIPLVKAAQSLDDVIGRDAWEFSWRIIGTDVLYETVRFPVTLDKLTFARSDGSFYDVATSDIKIMGGDYPFYTAGNGVECYVLVAEPREDWLPDYAASRMVYWIDKHYFYPLRIEQYGADGKLLSIQVRLARQENPALGPEGYTNCNALYWDPKVDLIGYSLHDAHRVVEWTDAERAVMFTPDFMRRRWLKYRQPSQALVDSAEQFYLRPSLEAGKFPEERDTSLPADLEERIRAQEAAGRLVFTDDLEE